MIKAADRERGGGRRPGPVNELRTAAKEAVAGA